MSLLSIGLLATLFAVRDGGRPRDLPDADATQAAAASDAQQLAESERTRESLFHVDMGNYA